MWQTIISFFSTFNLVFRNGLNILYIYYLLINIQFINFVENNNNECYSLIIGIIYIGMVFLKWKFQSVEITST